MSAKIYLALGVILAGVGIFILINSDFNFSASEEEPDLVVDKAPLEVSLVQQNNSGQNGVATVTETEGGIVVRIDVTGSVPGVAQPAHIHSGTCAELGGIEYPLTSVLDGSSETTVEVSLDDLFVSSMAINVHKSVDEVGVYVACGNIVR